MRHDSYAGGGCWYWQSTDIMCHVLAILCLTSACVSLLLYVRALVRGLYFAPKILDFRGKGENCHKIKLN